MHKKVFLLSIITSTLLITACGSAKNQSFDKLDQYLEKTETKQKDRTAEWFASQEEISDHVVDMCKDYFLNQANTKGGEYSDEINDDLFSHFKDIPDCDNARKGQIKNMGKTQTPLTKQQLDQVENEANSPQNTEKVNQIAKDVAAHLDQLQKQNGSDDNQGKQVYEQYQKDNLSSSSEPIDQTRSQ